MTATKIIFLVLILLDLILLLMGNKNQEYKNFTKTYGKNFQLNFMAPAALFAIDSLHLNERFSGLVQYIHEKIIRIYGSLESPSYTRMFMAQTISAVILIPTIITMLTVAGEGGPGIIIFGFVLAPLVAYLLIVGLDNKIKAREQAIILELPEFLNKIVLLVNAGENAQEAILRSIESKLQQSEQHKNKILNPLYVELKQVLNELHNNIPFQDAIEDFSKRCAVHEAAIFSTTVLLNYRRGGGEFVQALQELSRNLWEKRTAVAKILGEEASSKLVFPMVVIFLVIMIVVAAPAIMSM